MATIQLRGDDAAFMQTLSAQLAQDLQRVGLAAEVQIHLPDNGEATRGDPVTLGVIALSAVAAGGALTVFLGKDGGLSALAKVLEKYLESRRVEVLIESDDGKKVQVSGSLTAIKAVLKQVQSGDFPCSITHWNCFARMTRALNGGCWMVRMALGTVSR